MDMRSVQLQYGIRDGKIISVSELKEEERGEKCGCICPGCGATLVARLGKRNQWHFAHHIGDACNIMSAQQTALHMLAKEIIEDSKELRFPGITIARDDYIDGINDYRVTAKIPISVEYKKSVIIKCDSVSLENKISNIVPDIIVTLNGRICLIEIAVTHFVDEEKERKIRELGLPLFEIDLSDLYESEYSRDELAAKVLTDPDNRTWKYNPRYGEAMEWAKKEYSKHILCATKEVEKVDEATAARAEMKRKRREEGEKRIIEIFKPEKYKKAILDLSNEQKTARYLEKVHFKVEPKTLPFFLNIPITGEMVFPCDRRIWQSALFDKFVFYRNSKGDRAPTIHIKNVQAWLKDHNDVFSIDWGLAYKTCVMTNSGEQKTIVLFNDVIVTFFNYLVYLGFLEPFLFQEAVIKRSSVIIPPNEAHARVLYGALQKVDWYSPDVNDAISRFISPANQN